MPSFLLLADVLADLFASWAMVVGVGVLRFCVEPAFEAPPRPRVAGVRLLDGCEGNSGRGVAPLRVTRCDIVTAGKGEPKSTSWTRCLLIRKAELVVRHSRCSFALTVLHADVAVCALLGLFCDQYLLSLDLKKSRTGIHSIELRNLSSSRRVFVFIW